MNNNTLNFERVQKDTQRVKSLYNNELIEKQNMMQILAH